MKTLKLSVAISVILLLAAGQLFAQPAVVSFRTGALPATWCPILGLRRDLFGWSRPLTESPDAFDWCT